MLKGIAEVGIPAGITSGNVLSLKGQGLKQKNSTERGNLYLIIEVEMPKDITDKQRELLERYRKSNKAYKAHLKENL